jgi:hypothetical protein
MTSGSARVPGGGLNGIRLSPKTPPLAPAPFQNQSKNPGRTNPSSRAQRDHGVLSQSKEANHVFIGRRRCIDEID